MQIIDCHAIKWNPKSTFESSYLSTIYLWSITLQSTNFNPLSLECPRSRPWHTNLSGGSTGEVISGSTGRLMERGDREGEEATAGTFRSIYPFGDTWKTNPCRRGFRWSQQWKRKLRYLSTVSQSTKVEGYPEALTAQNSHPASTGKLLSTWSQKKPSGQFSSAFNKKVFQTQGRRRRQRWWCHSVVSDSLQPHGLQHTRLPCLSLSPKLWKRQRWKFRSQGRWVGFRRACYLGGL